MPLLLFVHEMFSQKQSAGRSQLLQRRKYDNKQVRRCEYALSVSKNFPLDFFQLAPTLAITGIVPRCALCAGKSISESMSKSILPITYAVLNVALLSESLT